NVVPDDTVRRDVNRIHNCPIRGSGHAVNEFKIGVDYAEGTIAAVGERIDIDQPNAAVKEKAASEDMAIYGIAPHTIKGLRRWPRNWCYRGEGVVDGAVRVELDKLRATRHKLRSVRLSACTGILYCPTT